MCSISFFFVVFETESQCIDLVGLELTMETRLTLNVWYWP